MNFDQPDIFSRLDALEPGQLDELDFGVISMNEQHEVVHYNQWESQFSGLPPQNVIDRDFFESVAPCMNNYLVSQRYQDEQALDETIDYVFTVKMEPTPVRLRLLQSPDSRRCYLLVKKR